MKKRLLFIPILLLTLLLVACDTSDINLENHEYKNAYNEHSHFEQCDCGCIQHEKPHDLIVDVLKTPTCTETGKIKISCECGYTKYEDVEKVAHTFTEWETITEPTCITFGQAKRYCTQCNYTEYKDLEKVAHKPKEYETLNADCTHEGHIGGTYCEVCYQELSIQTKIDKTEHDFTPWETTIEANCMHIGQQKRTCKVCNKEEYQELPITSHTPVSYEDLEADCTHEGHTGGTYCKICNIELSPKTTVDKSTHTYTEYETTIPASCTNIGQEKRVCEVCGHEDYKIIPQKEHTPISGEGKESTCKEHGHTEGLYCKDCHKELEPQEVLALSDHNYSISVTTKEATLNQEGSITHTCSVCGTSYTETTSKLPLTQEIWQNSLTEEKLTNKYIEAYYSDTQLNVEYDITIMNKDNTKYIKLKNLKNNSIYEYYYSKYQVVETCVDGYRHKGYNEAQDKYKEYLDIILNSIYYSSLSYDLVTYETDYFEGQLIKIRNHKNQEDIATIGIKIDDDFNLVKYCLSAISTIVQVKEIGSSPNITVPTANHHYIENGVCTYCQKEYVEYSIYENGYKLTYYLNKTNNSLEFNYIKQDPEAADLTFVNPTYVKESTIERFSVLYYEGQSPERYECLEQYKYDETTGKFRFYFTGKTETFYLTDEKILFNLNQKRARTFTPYSGEINGQTFEFFDRDKYTTYTIDRGIIQIYEYKEADLYIVNGNKITYYEGPDLTKNILNQTLIRTNSKSETASCTTFKLVFGPEFQLDIYYDDVKQFENVEVYDWLGDSINCYVCFRVDGKEYEIHLNPTEAYMVADN